jgi:hypothetical protein
MAAPVRLINVADWTGGLNLRADAFQLGENESPDMMNVEVDPRGGFRIRRSWVDWALLNEEGTWNPRSLFSHVMGTGNEAVFLTNGPDLWVKHGGGFEKQAGVVCGGDPHAADFTSWLDDVYIACGRGNPSYRWSNGTLTAMTDPSLYLNWSNDPLDPLSNTMPKAEFAAVHKGYLWVANTQEAGTNYPYRIRFSHPNDPDAWAEDDWVSIPDAGGPITGIVPLRDQLVVFTARSVYAVLGYDLDSFSVSDITKTVGAVNRQCIARSEMAIYFVSWPQGVHRVTLESVDEISVSLRPAIESFSFSSNTDLQWLGWAGQRLYWSVPYEKDASAPTGTRTVFVFDPTLESWSTHRSGCGCGVAPIINGAAANAPIGTTRFGPSVLNLRGEETGFDVVVGVQYPIPAFYRTRWYDGGLPTIKKRWRRPDIVADRDALPYQVTLFVYHDYDSANAKRTKLITVGGSGDAGVWFEDPAWDGTDGSLLTPPEGAPIWWEEPDPEEAGWEAGIEGSGIEKSSSLGSSRAVQLEFRGETGRRWGVNALVLKYLLRRIR